MVCSCPPLNSALRLIVDRAHFQPRPRRYSQHLLLAVSIVSDLRLDKPRNTEFWDFSDKSHWSEYDWSTDEMRAFAGAYYLSSRYNSLLVYLRVRD